MKGRRSLLDGRSDLFGTNDQSGESVVYFSSNSDMNVEVDSYFRSKSPAEILDTYHSVIVEVGYWIVRLSEEQ